MASKSETVEVEVGDKVVRLSSPDRVYFPDAGLTKKDVFDHYLSVSGRHRAGAAGAAVHAAPVSQGH